MAALTRTTDPSVPTVGWRIGLHTSIAGGVVRALERAWALRCTAVQLFSASPRSWAGLQRRLEEEQAAAFRRKRRELGLDPVVIHANYLINLAAGSDRLYERSIRAFRGELLRAQQLEADYVVVHPGSRGTQALPAAIERVGHALRRAVAGLAMPPRVLLEGTAGQGSTLGTSFDELRQLLAAAPNVAAGICIDTAHLFAVGYDLRDPAGLDRCLQDADRLIGLQRLHVVHLNDSKAELGSRTDRHEHLGQGKIGRTGLQHTLREPRLRHCAFLLETPLERAGDDWRNIRCAWQLVGVRWSKPRLPLDGLPRRRRRLQPTHP